MILRPYQDDAISAVRMTLASVRSCLCVLPTGTGKTIIFSSLIHNWPGRCLVLAHRDELVQQARKKIKAITGETVEIEQAAQWANVHHQMLDGWSSRITIASVPSLTKERRLTRFPKDYFDLIIVDEAHHAVAPSYRRIVDHFESAKLVGVTATPDRTDEAALGAMFDDVAFDYGINDAIGDGWLVPIRQRFVRIDGLDFSRVKTQLGDLHQGQLSELMEQEKTCHEVVSASVDVAKDRKLLCFTASVAQAKLSCEIANRHEPGSSAWVSGDQTLFPKDERRAIISDYAKGNITRLFNCGVFTEGFDEPTVEVVSMARPTKSRSLYAQCIGRGTRTLSGLVDGLGSDEERRAAIAASVKPYVEVLDFVGNSGRHKLVHSGDILGGDYDADVLQEAEQIAERRLQSVDMEALCKEVQERKEERLARERAEAARKRHLVAKAKYELEEVSPFNVFDIRPPRKGGVRFVLSDKQKSLLRGAGVEKPERLSRKEASTIISEILQRRSEGKSDYRQLRELKRLGIDGGRDMTYDEARDKLAKHGIKTDGVSPKQKRVLIKNRLRTDISHREANMIMGRLAANNWRAPEDIRERYGEKETVAN